MISMNASTVIARQSLHDEITAQIKQFRRAGGKVEKLGITPLREKRMTVRDSIDNIAKQRYGSSHEPPAKRPRKASPA